MEESSEEEFLMLARGSDLLLFSLYGEVRICQGGLSGYGLEKGAVSLF